MAKRTAPPNKRIPEPPSNPLGAADEAQPYRDDPLLRFAPYDNLWDAIRADVERFGGGFEIRPLDRCCCYQCNQ